MDKIFLKFEKNQYNLWMDEKRVKLLNTNLNIHLDNNDVVSFLSYLRMTLNQLYDNDNNDFICNYLINFYGLLHNRVQYSLCYDENIITETVRDTNRHMGL